MDDTELLNQTEHISDIFTKIMSRILSDELIAGDADGVTIAQYQALKHLSHHGSSTIGSLAEGLEVSQPAATTLVDRMAKRGLVDRRPGKSDRRQAEVTLTEAAQTILDQLESERMDRLSRILVRMEPDDRRKFVESMQTFVAAALETDMHADAACLRCGEDHNPDCVVHRAHRTDSRERQSP